ncbi:DeoR/GlpR family DNA-binding transcription regulator [Arenibacterium sp. LLYu02]|uniref:DeoR/GlpR family DNA-binding transcription regulator n=1 Tax=Arenibacterium sp. LLYu02 TaxID=3404132 RepID=UPI003B217110
MKPNKRHQAILLRLDQQDRVSVEDLAALTGASRETIRRDLTQMDRAGLLRKVHGGAIRANAAGGGQPLVPVAEGPFHARMEQNVAAKRAIARKAVSILRPGDSLFVDTGSTTLYFAEALFEVKSLTVITNSGVIAALAAQGEGASVYQIGGEFRAGGQESLGAMALQQIAEMRAAHVVLTVGSVDASGVMDFDLQEAQVAKAMIARAAQVTVLADHSKFLNPAVFPVADLSQITRIVADAVPQGFTEIAAAQGVELLIA